MDVSFDNHNTTYSNTIALYIIIYSPRKEQKYTVLMDRGLYKKIPIKDVNKIGAKVRPGRWQVINGPLPPRH